MFIASVAPVGALFLGLVPTCLHSKLVLTQFLFHFNSKDTSQLISGIFNALQKLPKYFDGIANSIITPPCTIKIDNDDEAVREIREHIKELIGDGVKVNNFDEMKKEIIEHVKNLKEQGANVKVDEDQINDVINKIFDKKYEKYEKKNKHI